MTILMTGGTGFIGGHLSAQLRRAEITTSRLVRNSHHPNFDRSTDFVGDFANATDVDRFAATGEILIHLACTSNPRSSNRDILTDLQQNLLATVYLFESFSRRKPRGHIIFASTGGDMYSFDLPRQPRREEDTPRPQSSYGIHKLAAEQYLCQFCRTYGMAGTILRISNPYGDPVSEERAHGLIGVAMSTLYTCRQMAVVDSLSSVRDYLHLDDLCAAFQAVIANPPGPGACRLLHVGSGIGHSIAEVFEVIERVSGRSINWDHKVSSTHVPSWNVLDSSKLRSLTGWKARINLEQGVELLWRRIQACRNEKDLTAATASASINGTQLLVTEGN